MKTPVLLAALCLLALSSACSSGPTRQAPTPVVRHQQEPPTRGPSEEEVAAKSKEQEKKFTTFQEKMDEYQNLLGICDKISDSEEDAEYRASCNALLGTLKTELRDLFTVVEDQ